MPPRVDRRDFVKLALTTAAGASLGPFVLNRDVAAQTATPPPAAAPAQQPAPAAPLPPLGNGEPPAVIFQAYPGGTGAYLEKIRKERGSAAFDRVTMNVESWRGVVPGNEEDIAFLPVHRLAALIQSKRITSVELTRIYLDRLKRLDPVLLCAVTIMEGQAREAAQQADAEIKAGRYRGPLHGIPYGLKDLFSTKGVRTTWGSSDFDKRVIDEDAEVAVRLRDAGAVLVAKLATGRFASGDVWYRGTTKNPWNPTQGSSGSSAGPASATAAGCVAFGIGTETQGSIRVAGNALRTLRVAPHIRARQPPRRDGARLEHGQSRAALPHRRGLRAGLQRHSWRRRERSVDRHSAVPIRAQGGFRETADWLRRVRHTRSAARHETARARRKTHADETTSVNSRCELARCRNGRCVRSVRD